MANTFKSFQSTGVTTETTVYTGAADTQVTVIGLTVANTGTSPVYGSVKLNGAYLVKDAPIAVGGTLVAVGGEQKIVVEPTDTVAVSADGTVDVILSVLEIS
jgi:hypothetical protein